MNSTTEQLRQDADAANFRLTIITSFLLGATMILLSLNVSIIRQSATAGLLGTVEWLLVVSLVLMLTSAVIMLFMSYVILQTIYLTGANVDEKLRSVRWARTLVGTASVLILFSFGSTFIVSLGLSSLWSLVLGLIGYGGAVSWVSMRGYYLKKYVHPMMREPDG